MGSLFEHGNEGPDGLVRVAEQHIVLLHLGGKVVVRRRQHGPCSRVEQFRPPLRFHAAGELVEKAQIQRAFLLEHPFMGEQQTVAQQAFYLRGRGGRDLQTHRSQLAAAFEQFGHDLAVVDIMIHHALFYVDIRIAGNAEEAFFLNRLFAKDAGRKVQHQLFGKCKLRFAVFFYNVHPFHLAGNGNDAKALPCRVFFLEQNAKVNLLIAQEWERMAVIHDLRAEDGEQLRLEVLLPEVLVLLGQMVKVHLAPAALRQCFQRLCVVSIALLLQLCRFGHDGCKLLCSGHIGLVFTLDLFALFLFQIGAFLQGAYAHHKELIQIGAVDRKKFDPLCKRNIFILSQRKNAPVEIQPAQFPVDKNGIVTHNHSPFLLRRAAGCGSAHGCHSCPGIHNGLCQARNIGCIFYPFKRAILRPVIQNRLCALFPYARQCAQRREIGSVQIHQHILFQPGRIRQDLRFGSLQRHGKAKGQHCAQNHRRQ